MKLLGGKAKQGPQNNQGCAQNPGGHYGVCNHPEIKFYETKYKNNTAKLGAASAGYRIANPESAHLTSDIGMLKLRTIFVALIIKFFNFFAIEV